jgi:redox-sensitive bicupin YhaK (pirin superfamily)
MITLHDRMARGRTETGWLDSRHTFSFGSYFNPAPTGFRSLRVMNEDRVIAGAGFPRHGDKDMEIITYVLAGALEHRDSLGNGSVIRSGDVQRMSAGTGISQGHGDYYLRPCGCARTPRQPRQRFRDPFLATCSA